MFAILALDISRIGWSRWRLDRLDLRALLFRNFFEQERPTVEPLAEKLDVAAVEPNDAPISVLDGFRLIGVRELFRDPKRLLHLIDR